MDFCSLKLWTEVDSPFPCFWQMFATLMRKSRNPYIFEPWAVVVCPSHTGLTLYHTLSQRPKRSQGLLEGQCIDPMGMWETKSNFLKGPEPLSALGPLNSGTSLQTHRGRPRSTSNIKSPIILFCFKFIWPTLDSNKLCFWLVYSSQSWTHSWK